MLVGEIEHEVLLSLSQNPMSGYEYKANVLATRVGLELIHNFYSCTPDVVLRDVFLFVIQDVLVFVVAANEPHRFNGCLFILVHWQVVIDHSDLFISKSPAPEVLSVLALHDAEHESLIWYEQGGLGLFLICGLFHFDSTFYQSFQLLTKLQIPSLIRQIAKKNPLER